MRLFPPYMTKLLKLVGETNCKARIRPKADTVGTTALELVREMWASLLNEAPSMTSDKLASEIARIERIQSHFESQMSLKPLKARCTRRPSIRGRAAAARRAWAIALKVAGDAAVDDPAVFEDVPAHDSMEVTRIIARGKQRLKKQLGGLATLSTLKSFAGKRQVQSTETL